MLYAYIVRDKIVIMPTTTDSNAQRYKKVSNFTKFKTKKDQSSKDVQSLYANNIWDLQKKFTD